MATKKFNKRLIHERSYLSFHFPQPNNRSIVVNLPFLESPIISESRKANLAEYSLLSRSGSLYSFLGAKSRNLSLTFNITLLHVIETMGSEGISDKFTQHFSLYADTKDIAKKAFFNIGIANIPDTRGISTFGKGIDHATKHRDFYRQIANIKTGIAQPTFFDDGINALLSFLGAEKPTQESSNVVKVINLVLFWLNLVRASNVNNSLNTSLGPPILRLNHGPMYNNVPLICDSYTITTNESAGYDLQSLLSRQFQVNMTLNEVRSGNFGEFKTAKFEDGDNLAGWEAVLSDNNMDPYNDGVKIL